MQLPLLLNVKLQVKKENITCGHSSQRIANKRKNIVVLFLRFCAGFGIKENRDFFSGTGSGSGSSVARVLSGN